MKARFDAVDSLFSDYDSTDDEEEALYDTSNHSSLHIEDYAEDALNPAHESQSREKLSVTAVRKPDSRKRWSLATLWLILWGLIGGFFCWPNAGPDTVPELQASVASTESHDSHATINMGDAKVGMKTVGTNPLREEYDTSLPEVDPKTWQLMTLKAPKKDGSWSDIQMLRPVEWIEEQSARVGHSIYISVPECGIDGDAEILDISFCPPIAPGDGEVITATYKHQNASIIDVKIASEPVALGSTPNHPFWSEDRQQFVRADELNLNERVRTLAGVSIVEQIRLRPGRHIVYNIEVKGEHVYHVGTGGVLVHNGDHCTRLNVGVSGHHVPAIRKSIGRPFEVSRSDKTRPTFFSRGDDPGYDHWRLHNAEREFIGPRQGEFNGTDDELLEAYRQAYRGLDDIRLDVRSPNGEHVLGLDVSPAEGVELIANWLFGQGLN
ncbi:polymorphic toxin-type HINT domain-containing protein [Polystyrenella longa]|nr:polymorphic toxin-type HINT domain-containing protein [Polystyrenella longa]